MDFGQEIMNTACTNQLTTWVELAKTVSIVACLDVDDNARLASENRHVSEEHELDHAVAIDDESTVRVNNTAQTSVDSTEKTQAPFEEGAKDINSMKVTSTGVESDKSISNPTPQKEVAVVAGVDEKNGKISKTLYESEESVRDGTADQGLDLSSQKLSKAVNILSRQK